MSHRLTKADENLVAQSPMNWATTIDTANAAKQDCSCPIYRAKGVFSDVGRMDRRGL